MFSQSVRGLEQSSPDVAADLSAGGRRAESAGDEDDGHAPARVDTEAVVEPGSPCQSVSTRRSTLLLLECWASTLLGICLQIA